MISVIKERLLEDPEKIKELLEAYDYHHVNIRSTYISFGRSEDSSPKSLVIQLKSNENLIAKDYARNMTMVVFNLILRQRNTSFRSVIQTAKRIVGLDEFYRPEEKYKAFGGFYSSLRRKCKMDLTTYDESILNKYIPCSNARFMKDGISVEAQRYFGIRYSVADQAIVIPIYSETGDLIGVKARANYDVNVEAGEQKYYYLTPCLMSQTLYAYSHNYEYLESADVVYVVEAEKSVMAAYAYGVRNIVALGSGTISRKQVQMLLALNPKKIVFLHDVNYPLISIMRNIHMVRGYSRMKQVELGYWNYFGKDYEDKASPTDMGERVFKNILENEIRYVGEDSYAED